MWSVIGSLILMLIAKDKIIAFLNNISLLFSPYTTILSKILIICFFSGILYYLVIVFYFFFNTYAKKDNNSYLKYLRKHWKPSLAEEKERKFIYDYIIQNVTDCCMLENQLKNFISECTREHQEYIINIIFRLIKHYTAENKKYFSEELVKVIQTMYKDNSRYIDNYIVNNIDENYIIDNVLEFQKQLYLPQLNNDDYHENINAVRFYNVYYEKKGVLLYKNLFLNTIKDVRKQMRIIWLIYEDNTNTSNCILQKIKDELNIDNQLSNLINVLLCKSQKREELESEQAPQSSPSKEDAP